MTKNEADNSTDANYMETYSTVCAGDMSTQVDELAKALNKFQSKAESVKKNRQGYGYKYADLTAVWDSIRKNLTSNGLSIVQLPIGDNGEIGLKTLLMHSSGQWVTNTVRVNLKDNVKAPMTPIQTAGSILTYLRRYGASAVLGVDSDEDTDGANVAMSEGEKVGDKFVKERIEKAGTWEDLEDLRQEIDPLDVPGTKKEVDEIKNRLANAITNYQSKIPKKEANNG